MVRLVRFAILLSCILVAASAFATTYYIAANGSDSNNGTSTSTPWLHAPGMTGCTANCQNKAYGQSGYTIPSAGDRFILRGGDSWYFASSGKTPVGLPWVFGWDPVHSTTWNGSSSSHIYVGVDHTWYNATVCGSSWCRPKMNGANPPSTTVVASCAYSTGTFLAIDTGMYNDFDDLEFTGMCDSGGGDKAYIQYGHGGGTADYRVLSNLYFHNFTATASGGANAYAMYGSSYENANPHDDLVGLVCDNSDGLNAVAMCFFQGISNLRNSVMRNAWQGIVTNSALNIHDNLFELIHNPYPGSGHANGMEQNTGYPGASHYFYNNLIRNIDAAVTMWTCAVSGYTDYYFNNVVFNTTGWAIANANYNQAGNACASSTGTSGFFSNTLVGQSGTGSYASWNSNLQNNFLVDSSWRMPASPPVNEISTTAASATSYGYSSANSYEPTSANCNNSLSAAGCPAGKGGNLTSVCNAIPNATAKAACLLDTTLGPKYDSVNHRVTGSFRNPTARPSGGAWDVGAYQYSTGSATAPAPPSGLSATVN